MVTFEVRSADWPHAEPKGPAAAALRDVIDRHRDHRRVPLGLALEVTFRLAWESLNATITYTNENGVVLRRAYKPYDLLPVGTRYVVLELS